MDQSNSRDHGNRNFFWLWFVAVNATLLVAVLWIGAAGLLAPLIGIGGAFASLFFAKWLAVRAHGIRIIDPAEPATDKDRQVHAIVADLAQRAGLERVPAVGIYESPDLNAFATGASQRDALIAFTLRLVDELSPNELRAVAAHEVAHIANRDMLAMVLLQGAVNSIVIAVVAPFNILRLINLLSDQFSWAVQTMLWLAKLVIALILTFVGSLFVKAFSRKRELRADAFAARLCGPEPMIAALRTIDGDAVPSPRAQLGYAAFKIAGRPGIELLSTHPSIARRIAALGGDAVTAMPLPAQA